MQSIRLATAEEIDSIRPYADLTPASQVLRFHDGWAVLRSVVEVDPVQIANPVARTRFMEHIESHLRLLGAPSWYFNIAAEDVRWQEIANKWGAARISKVPEFRFKKSL